MGIGHYRGNEQPPILLWLEQMPRTITQSKVCWYSGDIPVSITYASLTLSHILTALATVDSTQRRLEVTSRAGSAHRVSCIALVAQVQLHSLVTRRTRKAACTK